MGKTQGIVTALRGSADVFEEEGARLRPVYEGMSQAADLIDTLQQRNASLAATVIEAQSLCNLEDAYDAVDRIQEICKAALAANGDVDV